MRVIWFASTSVTGNDIVTVLTGLYFPVSHGKGQEEESFAMRQQRQQSAEVVFDSGEESETRADVEERTFIEGEGVGLEREKVGREREGCKREGRGRKWLD
ncbi:hypothetical protein FRC18_009455 [Serendipita sp. 400]|nr:hypothetical protein FRC18_009455 [Serendipita sp. 400]